MVATGDSLSYNLNTYPCPVTRAYASVAVGSLKYYSLAAGADLVKGEKNALFGSYTCRLDTSVHSTVAFPSGYIYSNATPKWHKISVASSSYYSESQDDAIVQHNDYLPHTSLHPVRAPWHVFWFLDGRTVSQLPVNDRFDCGIETFETRMEDGQRRCRKFAFWTVEGAWNFKCCGITIHVHLSGSYGRSTRTGIFVAAVIIPFHCGDRQRQAGNGLTKVKRRGSSTVSYQEQGRWR